MSEPTAFVRYSDAIEQVAPDEQDTVDAIVACMTSESETVARRTGHAVRASHAKSHGLLKGTLVVAAGLPEPYRQGLFAVPRSYPVAIRLAVGPGELLSDGLSTHRGMALKLFGVDGPKLPGHEGETTQDFVLASGPVFPQADAAAFLRSMQAPQRPSPLPMAAGQASSTAARPADGLLDSRGAASDQAGHPPIHPLADTYYSQAALRFGDYVAKLAVAPVSPGLVALIDDELDTANDPDRFRSAVSEFTRIQACELELRVQLCTDLDTMPVEDASTPWPEADSPYLPVARILVPAQDSYGPARQAYMDDVMSFRPAHSLRAHRPLGSLMRARLHTYPRLSAFRHDRNGQIQHEPISIDELPD